MTTKTLSLWGNGAVTLPKEWRDKNPTKHFLAVMTADGLLIKPILTSETKIEYYEKKDGSFGLNFPNGIDAEELLSLWDSTSEKVRGKKRGGLGKRRSAAKRG